MIQSEERNDVTPVCPHCNEPLRAIQYRPLSGFLGKRYVYFCARLPQGAWASLHRKGFWMG